MKLIFDHIGKYKAASILSPVFKLLEACFELTVPLIVAGIIDNGIKQSDMHYVWTHVPILALFAVVGFASAITAQYFAAYSACGISSGIRKSLHDKLQTLSISDYEKIGSSSIVTLMTSDVNQIQTGINLFLRLLLRSPFIVVGACIMAAVVKPSMQPENNVVRNIIYSADNSVVKMTMIDGKILYEDGQYKTIDLDEVIRECNKFKKDLA